MPDIDEQRKKVDELKKKILEQKKKGSVVKEEPAAELPAAAPVSVGRKEDETPMHGGSEILKKPEASPMREGPKNLQAESSVSHPVQSTTMASLKAYVQVLRQAWTDGSISKDEEEMLRTLRTSLGVSEPEHESLQHEVQTEIYQNLVMRIWKQGSMSPQDSEKLDFIREKFNISADEHMRIEKTARQILLQKK